LSFEEVSVDPRVSAGPVVAALGNQADVVAVPFQPEAIAVILNLVEPICPGGHGFAGCRQAKLEFVHVGKIGARRRVAILLEASIEGA
jgi:hypothetical protein